jgi:ribosomal-protein-alanine N-acetyltransferase
MTYRNWKYDDIVKISDLEEKCFAQPWTYQMLADSFLSDNFISLLCEDEGKIVGYGGIVYASDMADLVNIAVDENYRKRGIGRKMLDTLTSLAEEKGVKKLFFEVRVSNNSALFLYLKSGFTGQYVRPRYYPNGEDAIVMYKILDQTKEK